MRYLRARSAREAVDKIAAEGAAFLAGGTDLVTMRDHGQIEVRTAVDIKHAADLGGVEMSASETRVGATATMRQVARIQSARPSLRALSDGAAEVGAPQTRARATLGGNVCRASPAGDTLPALLVLNADVLVQDADRRWSVPADQFFTGPGRTVLARGQLVTGVRIGPFSGASAYERFTYRASLDLAVVGVAVAVDVDDAQCVQARIALGGVGPTPFLVSGAAQSLLGRPDEATLVEAGAAAARMCAPIDDVRGTELFRRRAVAVLVERVARRALAAAGVRL